MTESYQPLTPEDISELLKHYPKPQSVLDHSKIREQIETVEFTRLSSGRTIVCEISTKNGFIVTGTAKVLDIDNHIEALGNHYAYQDAYGKLIPIFAYLQREEMMGD